MNKLLKRILTIVLAFTMVLSLIPANVYAAGSAADSTESVDDPVEPTVNAEVYFVQPSTNKVITLDGIKDNPIDCKTIYDPANVPENGIFTVYYDREQLQQQKERQL